MELLTTLIIGLVVILLVAIACLGVLCLMFGIMWLANRFPILTYAFGFLLCCLFTGVLVRWVE